jgi:hypothetical protein
MSHFWNVPKCVYLSKECAGVQKTVTFPLSIFQTAQFCVIVCTYKWQLRVWMYRIKQEYFSNVNKINMQEKPIKIQKH